MLESIAAGIPAIATQVRGNRYVIKDGLTGSLVPPRDVLALSEQILRPARDVELRRRLGINGRRRFWEHFKLKWMFESYADLYRKLVN